ncbi:MAG: hypothetical protein M3Z15_09785 [Pseudomonadota bacterium]|nr:hypothetical protein [Pseudomonadota bacterium]
MKHLLIVMTTLAGLAGTAAHAQTIFRCGQEYTSVPCADARTLVVASAVTAEQRAEAREVARREKTLAAEMTRDRRQEEALLKPALAGSLSGPRVAAPPAPAKKHPKKRKRNAAFDDERDFIAAVPKAKKAGI